jgi:teichuronic acid biosynthesis glycosyltransferase TuaC
MHMFVISPGYPTPKTIDFIFVDQLCQALAKKGIKITIIAPQSLTKSIIRRVPLASYFRIIPINNGKEITLFRPLYLTLGNFKWFKRFNKKNFNKSIKYALNKINKTPDICYGHFWESAYSAYPYAKEYNIPLFVSSGEELISIQKNYSFDKLKDFVEYVNGVISVSTKNKNEIINAKLADDDKCKVIPNAIDPKLFYKKNKNELRKLLNFSTDDFIVAFVGQFTERKGVLRLSKALNNLNDPSIKAMFIGAGPQVPDYKQIIHQGIVDHSVLPDYLNCADVFVLPTINEGCSNSIIEAMACGLPIISSDMSFNHDILDDKNSLLIDPRNIGEIAKAIRMIKTSNAFRIKLSENALLTSSKLSIEKRADRIIEYIQLQMNR